MPTTSIVSKLLRPTAPLLLLAALFVAAGGAVHLREWLDTYRHVPATVPGANVVRVGFVIIAAASAVLAVALVGAVFVARRAAVVVAAMAALVEATSLATLIQTRRGTVFGWMERGWSLGATQTRAIEVGALSVFSLLFVVTFLGRRAHGAGVDTLDSVDEIHRSPAVVAAS